MMAYGQLYGCDTLLTYRTILSFATRMKRQ
jgi:hypothetical protein